MRSCVLGPRRAPTLALLLALFASLAREAGAAPAGEAPAAGPPAATATSTSTSPEPRRRGPQPRRDPRVSLSLERATIGEGLTALARKAGWSLTASGPWLDARLSITIDGQPATVALDRILEAADLVAELTAVGGREALVVRPRAAPVAAAAAPAAGEARAPVKAEDDEDEDEDPPDEKGHRGAPDRTAVGEGIVIEAGETVDDVVATGGSVIVKGRALGDAVAVGGNVTLEPGAEVVGDAVAVGGAVEVKPGAKLGGERTSVGGALGKLLAGSMKMAGASALSHADDDGDDEDEEEGGFWGDLLFELWFAAVLFGVGFLLTLLVPDSMRAVREILSARPLASAAAGLGAWVGLPALCVLLTVTIVGLLLVPVAVLLFGALHIAGLAAVARWIGDRLPLPPSAQRPVVALAAGTAIITLLHAVPWVGTVLTIVMAAAAAGAGLLGLIGTWRRRRQERAAAQAPA